MVWNTQRLKATSCKLVKKVEFDLNAGKSLRLTSTQEFVLFLGQLNWPCQIWLKPDEKDRTKPQMRKLRFNYLVLLVIVGLRYHMCDLHSEDDRSENHGHCRGQTELRTDRQTHRQMHRGTQNYFVICPMHCPRCSRCWEFNPPNKHLSLRVPRRFELLRGRF